MTMTDREERMLLELFKLKHEEAAAVVEHWKSEEKAAELDPEADSEGVAHMRFEVTFARGRALAWAEAKTLLDNVVNG